MYIAIQTNINKKALIPEGTATILGTYNDLTEATESVENFVKKGINEGFDGDVRKLDDSTWMINDKDNTKRGFIQITNLDFVKNWDNE